MINVNEKLLNALRGEGLTLEETVKLTDTLLEATFLTSQESVNSIYNTLAIIEDAIVIPAVYSVMSKDQQFTQPYRIFSKHVEVAISKADEIMYNHVQLQDGSIVKRPTGTEAYIMVTNTSPSQFPTVDLSILANALLAYNVDYKRSELTDIVTTGYCLSNIQENEVRLLSLVK